MSKNIELKEYTTKFVIQELQKVNLSKKLDLNKADFRNTGELKTRSLLMTAKDRMQLRSRSLVISSFTSSTRR